MATATNEASSYSQLRKEIEGGRIFPLYLLTGEESYLVDSLLRLLRRRLLKPEYEAINLSQYRPHPQRPLPGFAQLLQESQTPAFGGEKRLFLYYDTGWFGSGASKNEDLLHFIQAWPEEACLVLIESKIDRKQKKALQTLLKKGRWGDFATQKPEELEKWLAGYARHLGLGITTDAAQSLLARTQGSMWQLSNEIKKLALYAQAENMDRIDFALVELLSPADLSGNIFQLLEALASQKNQVAMECYHQLLEQGEPRLRILYMLSRQTRQYLLSSDCTSSQSIATELNLSSFVARKLFQQGKNFTVDQLLSIHRACFRADLAIKSGQMDEETALLWLMAKILQKESSL